MKTLIIMSGLPGCGKSTLAKEICEKLWLEQHHPDYYVVSRDDIIQTLASMYDTTYNIVWEKGNKLIDHFLQKEIEFAKSEDLVLWDQTHLDKKSRAKSMAHFPDYRKICIQFSQATLDSVTDRLNSRKGKIIPENVYQNFYGRYEVARLEEGFDRIIRVQTSDGKCYGVWDKNKTIILVPTEMNNPVDFIGE